MQRTEIFKETNSIRGFNKYCLKTRENEEPGPWIFKNISICIKISTNLRLTKLLLLNQPVLCTCARNHGDIKMKMKTSGKKINLLNCRQNGIETK